MLPYSGSGRTYRFSHQESRSGFPGGLHNFHRRLYPGLGRSHGGFPDFGCLDLLRLQAPHQCAGAQDGKIGPSTLGLSIRGPPCYDRYRQYHCCSLYQQTGLNPFAHPVAAGSGSVSIATVPRYSHPGQTHSGLPQFDSRPVILAEPANHNRVEPPPRSSESIIQAVGDSSSGHVCHSPQRASSPVYVSSSRATSTGDRCSVTGLVGEVDVHVSAVSPAQKSHLEAQDDPGARGDTHHKRVFHTYYDCVWTTLDSFRSLETYCHNRDMSRAASRTICTHGVSHAALPNSSIFERDL